MCIARQIVLSKPTGFGQKILEKQIKTKVAHRLGMHSLSEILECYLSLWNHFDKTRKTYNISYKLVK